MEEYTVKISLLEKKILIARKNVRTIISASILINRRT
jgi:hypothetical protein